MQSFLGDNPLFGHKLQEADTYESHKLFCHIRFYLFNLLKIDPNLQNNKKKNQASN